MGLNLKKHLASLLMILHCIIITLCFKHLHKNHKKNKILHSKRFLLVLYTHSNYFYLKSLEQVLTQGAFEDLLV